MKFKPGDLVRIISSCSSYFGEEGVIVSEVIRIETGEDIFHVQLVDTKTNKAMTKCCYSTSYLEHLITNSKRFLDEI